MSICSYLVFLNWMTRKPSKTERWNKSCSAFVLRLTSWGSRCPFWGCFGQARDDFYGGCCSPVRSWRHKVHAVLGKLQGGKIYCPLPWSKICLIPWPPSAAVSQTWAIWFKMIFWKTNQQIKHPEEREQFLSAIFPANWNGERLSSTTVATKLYFIWIALFYFASCIFSLKIHFRDVIFWIL